jgi:hypothetical protein
LAGQRHEAGVRAGPAGRRAGALRRRVAPQGTDRARIYLWLPGCGYAVVLGARKSSILLVQELEELDVPVDSVKIRYSPFSRTTETARAVAGVLGVPFDGPSCKVSGSWMNICSVNGFHN